MAEPARKHDHLWKPGQSGNPRGRPKGTVTLGRRVRERVEPEQLVAWFIAVWNGDIKPSKEQETAATWITERGWGKAPNFMPIEGGDPLGIEDIDRDIAATEARLDELAARRKAATARAETAGAVAAPGENGTDPTPR